MSESGFHKHRLTTHAYIRAGAQCKVRTARVAMPQYSKNRELHVRMVRMTIVSVELGKVAKGVAMMIHYLNCEGTGDVEKKIAVVVADCG